MKYFNQKLLDHIRFDRHEQAKPMIKKGGLAIVSDHWGSTLLHYAAAWNSAKTISDLIEMGSEVDSRNSESKTPLMVAVIKCCPDAVKALLKANASYEIVDADDKTALHHLFTLINKFGGSRYCIDLFVERFKRDALTGDEIAERLDSAGITMQDACSIAEPKWRIEVVRGLLERGIDVNKSQCPALIYAGAFRDVELAKCLIDHGADINSVGPSGDSPLCFAVFRRDVEMVSLLLERGANPNVETCKVMKLALSNMDVKIVGLLLKHGANSNVQDYNGLTPLDVCLKFQDAYGLDDFYGCMELLFEHGAVFQHSRINNNYAVLDWALSLESSKMVKLLIAHLAILGKQGMPIVEIIMNDELEKHPEKLPKLQKDYEKCKQMLESKVYGELTLFELLNECEDKMRSLVRNESLMTQVKRINPQLGKSYPWYFKLLKKRSTKAIDFVKLEEEAIVALCKLLNHSYYQCYTFARQIVGYLNEHELQQLSQA